MSSFQLPDIQPLSIPAFPIPEQLLLDNSTKVFVFREKFQPVIRLDIVFKGGRWNEKYPLVADACSKLMKSGTASLSSYELDYAFDKLGCSIKASAHYDGFSVSLFTMTRYFEEACKWLQICLTSLEFPENEIDIQNKKALSNLQIGLQKMDFLADMAFKKMLFGAEHPYGSETTEEYINAIDRNKIRAFYVENILNGNASIYIAGDINESILNALNATIGQLPWNKKAYLPLEHAIISSTSKKLLIEREEAVQSSIMCGKILFNRNHEDFGAFLMLNAVLGGYFGSRLMSNIREEKGYTYGIYSTVQTYKNSGVFYIQTDVDKQNTEDCLIEIYQETDRLKEEHIRPEELSQARNYLAGKFLSRMDGAFQQMEVMKNYGLEDIDIRFFDEFAEKIMAVNQEDIRTLAEKHLKNEELYEVVAG